MTEQRYKKIIPHEVFERDYKKPPKKSEVFGDYLNEFKWNYWCTFTTRRPISINSARRVATQLGRLFCAKDLLNVDPLMFWAAEPFDAREGFHIHALLKCDYDKKTIQKLCNEKYGRSTILEYENGKGATDYCAKYISKNLSDYDFELPRINLNPRTSKVRKRTTKEPIKNIDKNRFDYDKIYNEL